MVVNPLIVILTKDRPDILERCIMIASKNEITSNAFWIVLDDSCKSISNKNFLITKKFVKKGIKIFHITNDLIKKMYDNVFYEYSKNDLEITFSKFANRDISGLRNLGLLFSKVFTNQTTYFIDDDIIVCENNHNKDNACFFEFVESNYKNATNSIIGCPMGGILDESYGGRLYALCEMGKDALLNHDRGFPNLNKDWKLRKNPLWSTINSTIKKEVTHVSGGFVALKLDGKSILPFPSVYNEDWIWCLLQKTLNKTSIFIDGPTAFHSPSSLFHPNIDEFVWEQYGEVMFHSILPVIQSNNAYNVEGILKLAKKNSAIKQMADELLEIIVMIESFISNSNNSTEHHKFNSCLQELRQVREILLKTDNNILFDSWLANFSRRNSFFSSIFHRHDLHKRIRNVIFELV